MSTQTKATCAAYWHQISEWRNTTALNLLVAGEVEGRNGVGMKDNINQS